MSSHTNQSGSIQFCMMRKRGVNRQNARNEFDLESGETKIWERSRKTALKN